MIEREFWTRLEYRVCSELAQFDDNRLRFLWCDGFVPERVEQRDDALFIVGHAWFGHDGQDQTPFTLVLGGLSASRETTDWVALLPSEDETEWLAVRDWGLEIVPPSAERDLLARRR